MLETVTIWATPILMVVGIVLFLWSLRFRTKEHPGVVNANPKNWRPIWMMKSWFTPKGYKIYVWGWGLFLIGLAIEIGRRAIA